MLEKLVDPNFLYVIANYTSLNTVSQNDLCIITKFYYLNNFTEQNILGKVVEKKSKFRQQIAWMEQSNPGWNQQNGLSLLVQ